MSDVNSPTSTNGADAPESRARPGAAELKAWATAQIATRPKVQQALAFAKNHPLGAVASVAAAAALVELQFAVGILTGLGATALLASKSGPEAREQVMERGKRALARARVVLAQRRKPSASAAVPPPAGDAPPPAN
jgi:hypothetical protein